MKNHDNDKLDSTTESTNQTFTKLKSKLLPNEKLSRKTAYGAIFIDIAIVIALFPFVYIKTLLVFVVITGLLLFTIGRKYPIITLSVIYAISAIMFISGINSLTDGSAAGWYIVFAFFPFEILFGCGNWWYHDRSIVFVALLLAVNIIIIAII